MSPGPRVPTGGSRACAANPPAMEVRDGLPADAEAICALFRVVYGEHYVYPDVYLPSQIRCHLASGRWRSAVALREGRLLGHAVLWREPDRPRQAELALNVVHPDARGLGVASRLGRHLVGVAPDLGSGLLTIKQVCAHPKSQHLARALGFHCTALLPDHVASPFGQAEPESIVFGCLPLRARPLPRLEWPASWHDWLAPLRRAFGECEPDAPAMPAVPGGLKLARHGPRLDMFLPLPIGAALSEVAAMPASLRLDLKMPATAQALACAPRLAAAGFRFGGLLPAPDDGWQLLWLRRPAARELLLCDEGARRLDHLHRCWRADDLPDSRLLRPPAEAQSALAGNEA